MNTKVAIITWCNNEWKTNYGQVLQAYALQRYLNDTGCDAFIINYRLRGEHEKGLFYRLFSNTFLYEELYKAVYIEKKYRLRNLRFFLFVKKYANISKPCHDAGQIARLVQASEYFVSGSDQIWNPYRFSPVRFWDIPGVAGKRVSYASSGIFTDSKELEPIYKKMKPLLEKYESISVREESGARILGKYLDRQITQVVDPVLLLEKRMWRQPRLRKYKQPYILCYFLGEMRPYTHILQYLKRKNPGSQIVFLYADDVEKSCPAFGRLCKNAGPKQFLSLIEHAEMVCTDSYHGTLFSLIFEKEFWLFSRKGVKGKKFSSAERWKTLFEDWQLGDRRVRNISQIERAGKIDYKSVREHMHKSVDVSKEFLRNALGGE